MTSSPGGSPDRRRHLPAILLTYNFLNRNMPRVDSKIGRRVGYRPPLDLPERFSRVDWREVIYFDAAAGAESFTSLKTYTRGGVMGRKSRVLVYRVASCNTRIEMSAASRPAKRSRCCANCPTRRRGRAPRGRGIAGGAGFSAVHLSRDLGTLPLRLT